LNDVPLGLSQHRETLLYASLRLSRYGEIVNDVPLGLSRHRESSLVTSLELSRYGETADNIRLKRSLITEGDTSMKISRIHLNNLRNDAHFQFQPE
jgi:hypothetical protein